MNKEPQFRFMQNVFITKGFYKGYFATITDYKETATGILYVVDAKLKNDQIKTLELTEDSIRPQKSFLSAFVK